MWPSENAIKETLSGTTELVFDTISCVKLNEKIVLAKSLDTALMASTIQSLNAAFEQEEKLALARQLRAYISSCHHQDQRKSEKLSLWKNFTRILPSAQFAFVSSPILLMVVLPCLIAWPIIVSSILICPFILLPFCLWFTQRLNYWLAETEKINNTTALIALTDSANHSEHPINPFAITSENKLFEECASKPFPNFPSLTGDTLAEKLADICSQTNPNLASAFKKHIGDRSNYSQKIDLHAALQVVYYRLNGDLNPTLGPLPEKAMLIEKLVEGVHACTPGLHNRVNTILESFHKPQNLSELLYLVRKHLLEKAAVSLKDDDVHTANRVTVIANTIGLGIRPNFADDIYPGNTPDQTIRLALESEFENNYTLFNLPLLLIDALRGILIEMGYSGSKEKPGYNATTFDDEVEKFTLLIRKYLGPDFQTIDWQDFFIIEEENFLVLDVNWKLIKQFFFEQLLNENYFGVPSFADFCEKLPPLLVCKDSRNWNYLMLLTHYQPEMLKLFFYYLQKHSNNITKEIKEQLVPLFFEKNKMGQHAVQLATEYHPDNSKVLLDFIDEHLDKFDLDFNDLMRAEKYHPESLKQILDFTEKHLTHADKHTIRAFFLQKNDSGWDTFINTAQNQPKTALAILNYIIKHPEMFNPGIPDGKSLFAENLSKIQQGLLNLMTIEKPDIERTNTLLKFISLYPELLFNTPKKLAHFILNSLTIIHDEKLIDTVVVSHAALLLKYFSIDYFTNYNKNLACIIEKLLCAYSAELTNRKSKNITHSSKLFKQHFGYSTEEKLLALYSLIDVLENSLGYEKNDKLKSLKTNHPALSNGRLSQLFKACRYNDAVTQQIKIEFQH